jgi:hypothetical protein
MGDCGKSGIESERLDPSPSHTHTYSYSHSLSDTDFYPDAHVHP